jgi:hypothetical protein
MHQIVYTSSSRLEFAVPDLKKLLVGARMRNKAVGVTGMLVFHDGTFLQALEGENRAVNEIFASIQNDPRHRDLTVLHRGPGPEQRVFGEWSMGFADFSGAAAILKGFVRVNDNLNLKELDGTRAVALQTACEDDEMLKSA